MRLSTPLLLVLGYHLLSRLAYVLYVGYALKAQERSGTFTRRWGAEEGFQRFRRMANFVMNNDWVSFVVLCFMSWHTLTLPLPTALVIGAGAFLFVLGSATKLWAAATVGGRAYYWHNFFAVEGPSLKTGGPYRFLKNPMYTVGYLLLYGLALFTMSLPGLLAAAFDQAAILAFHHYVEKPHFERWSERAMEPVGTSSEQRGDTTTE